MVSSHRWLICGTTPHPIHVHSGQAAAQIDAPYRHAACVGTGNGSAYGTGGTVGAIGPFVDPLAASPAPALTPPQEPIAADSVAIIRSRTTARTPGRVAFDMQILDGPHAGARIRQGITIGSSVWPYLLRAARVPVSTPAHDALDALIGRQVRVRLRCGGYGVEVARWRPRH